MLVMLCIPADLWQQPPRQRYIENLLEFFEKTRGQCCATRAARPADHLARRLREFDLFELGSA